MLYIQRWLSYLLIGCALVLTACSDDHNNNNNHNNDPSTPAQSIVLKGTISSVNGVGNVNGTRVSLLDASGQNVLSQAIANSQGIVILDANIPSDKDVVIKAWQPGFVEQALQLHTIIDGEQLFNMPLLPVAITIEANDFQNGGTFSGTQGASVVVKPDSFIDPDTGTPVTGTVQISMTPLDPASQPDAFPGSALIVSGGEPGVMISGGMVNYHFSQEGKTLALADGQTATIRIPLYTDKDLDGNPLTNGSIVPIWGMDSLTGTWTEQGKGVVMSSSASPTGFVVETKVTHFSWWNIDWAIPFHMIMLMLTDSYDEPYYGPLLQSYLYYYYPQPSTIVMTSGVELARAEQLYALTNAPIIYGIDHFVQKDPNVRPGTIPGFENVIDNPEAVIAVFPKTDFKGRLVVFNPEMDKFVSIDIDQKTIVNAINNNEPIVVKLDWDAPKIVVSYSGNARVYAKNGFNTLNVHAKSYGLTNKQVQWIVEAAEIDSCPTLGTISESGVYTAPAKDDLIADCKVNIYAISKADPSIKSNVIIATVVYPNLPDGPFILVRGGDKSSQLIPLDKYDIVRQQVYAAYPQLATLDYVPNLASGMIYHTNQYEHIVTSDDSIFAYSDDTCRKMVDTTMTIRCAFESDECNNAKPYLQGDHRLTSDGPDVDQYLYIVTVTAKDDPRSTEEFLFGAKIPFYWNIEK